MVKKREATKIKVPFSHLSVAPNINTSQQKDDLSREIDRWLLYCKSEGMSERTIIDYAGRIDKFYWWYGEYAHLDRKVGWHPENFTEDHIREFLIYLRLEDLAFRWGEPVMTGKGTLSPTTVFNYARVVRTFFNWLEGRHVIEKSPFSKHVKLTTKKEPARKRHYSNLHEDELVKLFTYLSNPKLTAKYNGARNLAMISLLLDSGMRLGEILSMRVCDIAWERKRITIRGKTGERVCFFSRGAEHSMDNYFMNFRRTQDDYLLPNDKYWLCKNGAVFTEAGFWTMVRVTCEKSGVKFHAHQLRHTFASVLATKVGVYELKELLGHSDINTTMIYVHGSTDANQEAHRGNSPLSVLDLGHTATSRGRSGRPKKGKDN